MNIQSKKGFTIIEVVLVLAIAGLIFLMVFVALPTMQRSQRDTQRRNDYAAFAANITNYLTNNNGNLPKAGATLDPKKYVNDAGTDGAGKTYSITVVTCTKTSVTVDGVAYANSCGNSGINPLTVMNQNAAPQIYLVLKAKCNTVQGLTMTSAGNRDFAVLGQLESGVFCQDNV